jgi:CspA family cold shock protein
MKGMVKWFDPKRGFGFIFCDQLGGDLFVHAAGIIPNEDGIKILFPDDVVEFETRKGAKGLKAINVRHASE